MADEEVSHQSLLTQKTQSEQCSSMVVIRDSDPHHEDEEHCIFPPAKHENLHLLPPSDGDSIPSFSSSSSTSWPSLSSSPASSISSFSPSDEENSSSEAPSPFPSDSQIRKSGHVVTGWMEIGIGIQVLRSKFFAIASRFGSKSVAVGWTFWSFSAPAARVAAAVVMLWWLYKRARRNRRYTRESMEQLRLIINEKDKKISELLLQIAQLNQVLLLQQKLVTSK